jgi:arylsulfatase A-like enzyme
MTIDVLPTVAGRVGAPLPPLPIDGRDVWPVLNGTGTNGERSYWFYYGQNQLQALRRGRWKLLLPHTAAVLEGHGGGNDGLPIPYRPLKTGLELYDLENDPAETRNVADEHPRVLETLLAEAETARMELGDSLTQRIGRGNRPPGQIRP